LIQDAVVRNLQVLAESTQRLSVAARALRPDIEWPRIAAFRNVLCMTISEWIWTPFGRSSRKTSGFWNKLSEKSWRRSAASRRSLHE
jgi:hypothetical protein